MKKILFIAVALAMLTGCTTTKYVEVERVKTDTVYQSKLVHDSIRVTDSVVVRQAGDTIFTDRWHTRWRERILTDTIYRSRTDSVPKPYPVEVKVPAELTSWQVFRIHAGEVAIVAILVGIGIFVKKRLL